MKTTFKQLTIFLVAFLVTTQIAGAIEKTKKYHQAWPVKEVMSMKISNKFGEVKFVNDGGTEVTVDVLVTVEASSDSKTQRILDEIDVKFSKSGSTVSAETSMGNNINAKRLSIDYVVNVPSDKSLTVSNKYGNVVVNKLTAQGEFDVQYGNINAVSLTGPITKVYLAYGKGNIDETGNVDLNIEYSNISLGTTGNVNLDCAYSVIDFDKSIDAKVDSKYDKLSFGEISTLIVDTKYTQVKVGKLAKKLQIDTGYGGIKVESVAPDFESISITNSYGQISLGLMNASYSLKASCSYCGITYPSEKFKGNRMKEDTSIQLDGKVGSGYGGTVRVDSNYGDIKLFE